MKMAEEHDANFFEFVVKMNSLSPGEMSNAPLPVKLMPVFYDPNGMDDPVNQEGGRDQEDNDKEGDTGLSPIRFIRDPIHEPGTSSAEDDATEEDNRLGRNMRASKIDFHKKNMSVQDVMNARFQLLQQQKEQLVLVETEFLAETSAAALVNDLTQQGFQIKPPQDQRPKQFQWPPDTTEEACKESDFILSVRKEPFYDAIQKETRRAIAKAP